MVKHFCDRCGKEMHRLDEFVVASVTIRRGLPRGEYCLELCKDCVDKSFGDGFTARCEADYAEKQKAAQERKTERMAKKGKQEVLMR